MPGSGSSPRPPLDDGTAPGEARPARTRRTVEITGSTRRGSSRLGPAPLGEIGIAGLSRSRVAWFLAALFIGWIAVGFVGQAGDTARAAQRAVEVKADNAALEREVAALRAEVSLVTDPHWVAQQARSYGLGGTKEIPFVLAPGASPLPADAPGSAARRIGTPAARRAPLEVWLDVLFGRREEGDPAP